jgi:hypothetical protein
MVCRSGRLMAENNPSVGVDDENTGQLQDVADGFADP